MEKKEYRVPQDCKVTGFTGFKGIPDWIDIKIDPPVEVRAMKDVVAYSIDLNTGIAKAWLRRYRSKWWKLIGTNAKKP